MVVHWDMEPPLELSSISLGGISYNVSFTYIFELYKVIVTKIPHVDSSTMRLQDKGNSHSYYGKSLSIRKLIVDTQSPSLPMLERVNLLVHSARSLSLDFDQRLQSSHHKFLIKHLRT